MPKQDQRPQPQLLQPLLQCHQEALLLREDHHHQRYLRCLRSQVRIESMYNVQGVPKNALIKQIKMAKHGMLVNLSKWSNRVRNGQSRC